jgi:Predicted AAA-ATPase/PD-(D/E)XK nuclease superfamily
MNEKKVNMKQIPYGVSDYEAIRLDNSYYVDKTRFLREIEEAGKYLFFIRPRRFGKSLFLSVMETYYDIAKEDKFELFYKGTDIFKESTEEKNSYLILKFNFSAVNPDINNVESSFNFYVEGVGEVFISKYHEFLGVDKLETKKEFKGAKNATDAVNFLIRLIRESEQRVYVIIDEYDNFANTILTSSGTGDYRKLTHGEGFFRSFFNVLKEGTSGSGAPISRLFITGVSPVTLDDVTSGFNIGKNISIDPAFNEMVGFTQADVIQMIDYYRTFAPISIPSGAHVDIMSDWYNHYLFSWKASTRLYNSDMVLYFVDHLIRNNDIPDNLIDRNVRIDYGKLRHLIILDDHGTAVTNGNFSHLKKLLEDGETCGEELVESFPLDQLTNPTNFLSLLFYFGLITIKEVVDGEPVFNIPNETARRLHYTYIKEAYEETETISIQWHKFGKMIHNMAYKGDWQPLFKYLAQKMKESLSLRDLIIGEKSVQAFLNVYLGLDQRFILHSEPELNHGFADILMEPFIARYKQIKYAYLLELKYLKKEEKNKLFQRKINEAKAQIQQYSMDSKLQKKLSNVTLIKLILIFCGPELIHIESC